MSFFDTNIAPYPLPASFSIPPPPRAIFVFCVLTSGEVTVRVTLDEVNAGVTLGEVVVGLTPEEVEAGLTLGEVAVRLR